MNFTFPFQNSLFSFSNFNQFHTTYIQTIHHPVFYSINQPYSNLGHQIENSYQGNNSSVWYTSNYDNNNMFYQQENLREIANQGTEINRNQSKILKNQDKEINNIGMEFTEVIQEQPELKIHRSQQKQSIQSGKVLKISKKRIYKQSPNRNIITNIGNKMITFLLSKKRNLHIIKRIHPEWKQAQIKHFYDFVKKIKRQLGYYLNLQKMENIWYRDVDEKYSEYQKLFRKLSHYYLANIFISAILSSTRIELDSKIRHLKSRRVLINKLRLFEDIQL